MDVPCAAADGQTVVAVLDVVVLKEQVSSTRGEPCVTSGSVVRGRNDALTVAGWTRFR